MGWTFTFNSKHQSILSFFRERWVSSTPGCQIEVLDCAVVERKTAYLACRITREHQAPYVFAAVCFLEYRPRDHYNFGYRDMDESSGPHAFDCPERILKLLTDLPEPSEHSRNWRVASWANLEKRRSAPKLARRVRIKTAKPVEFRGGVSESFFTCVDPKRLLFTGSFGGNQGIKFKLIRKAVRSAKVITTSEAA